MGTDYRREYLNTAQGTELKPTTTSAVITAFTLGNDIDTVSTIVAEYPITNVIPITIERPFMPLLKDEGYLVAVRSVDDSLNVARYLLYTPESFAILYPNYEGQTLLPGSIIEIWANPLEPMIMASRDLVFNLNAQRLYGVDNSTICYCTLLVNDVMTLTQTVMNPQPTGPCNPFCDCFELAAPV